MSHKHIQKISFLLVLLTMMPTIGSCAKKDSDNETTADTLASDSVVTEDSERAQYVEFAPVPEDLNQYEFRIMVEDGDATFNDLALYDSDEADGETLNDAIYMRNLAVEEAYNCTISLVLVDDDLEDVAKRNIMAGSDSADIMGIRAAFDATDLAANNYILDLKSLPELCLEAPWWDQHIESLAVLGKLYITTGAITVYDDLNTTCIIYSKKLAQDNDITDLNEHVLNGTWTWDTMRNLCKDVYADLDGDGVMGKYDRYGLIVENHGPFWLSQGAGIQTVIYDEANETYTSNWMDEDVFTKLNTYIDFAVSNPGVLISNSNKTDTIFGGESVENVFRADRALFWSDCFSATVSMRDSTSDFGILPLPKWDEQQEEYYCPVKGHFSPISMPTTIENQHAAATILEALAYESMFTLSPAFYDVFLDEKIMRDEESLAVVDLLLANKQYDFDYHLDITELDVKIRDSVKKHKNSLVSIIASAEKQSQNRLDNYVAKFEDLD